VTDQSQALMMSFCWDYMTATVDSTASARLVLLRSRDGALGDSCHKKRRRSSGVSQAKGHTGELSRMGRGGRSLRGKLSKSGTTILVTAGSDMPPRSFVSDRRKHHCALVIAQRSTRRHCAFILLCLSIHRHRISSASRKPTSSGERVSL
jgi:hypothetical protein